MIFYPCKLKDTLVTRSKIITEEGKFALDAIENNPNIEGSLADKINKNTLYSNKMSDMSGRHYLDYWKSGNNDMNNVYRHIFTLVIKVQYPDWLSSAEFYQRRNHGQAYIRITSTAYNSELNAWDTHIDVFEKSGNIDVYLDRVSINTYDFYIKNYDRWDTVYLQNTAGYLFDSEYVTCIRHDEFYQTLPSTAVQAVQTSTF